MKDKIPVIIVLTIAGVFLFCVCVVFMAGALLLISKSNNSSNSYYDEDIVYNKEDKNFQAFTADYYILRTEMDKEKLDMQQDCQVYSDKVATAWDSETLYYKNEIPQLKEDTKNWLQQSEECYNKTWEYYEKIIDRSIEEFSSIDCKNTDITKLDCEAFEDELDNQKNLITKIIERMEQANDDYQALYDCYGDKFYENFGDNTLTDKGFDECDVQYPSDQELEDLKTELSESMKLLLNISWQPTSEEYDMSK